MDTETTRARVQEIYKAYAVGDPGPLIDALHDDIDWAIHGPMEVFPFAGPRKGKAAVLEVLKTIAERFTLVRYSPEIIIADGSRAAVFSSVAFTQRATGRMLTFKMADFMRFDGMRTHLATLDIDGVVVIVDTMAFVEPDGSVSEVEVFRGLGHGLDEEAVRVVEQARFRGRTSTPGLYLRAAAGHLVGPLQPGPPGRHRRRHRILQHLRGLRGAARGTQGTDSRPVCRAFARGGAAQRAAHRHDPVI